MQLYLLETVVIVSCLCLRNANNQEKKKDGWELGPSGMKTFLMYHKSGLSGSME